MRDAGNGRQTVRKRRKNWRRKRQYVVIRHRSDELEKFWQGLGAFHPDPGFA